MLTSKSNSAQPRESPFLTPRSCRLPDTDFFFSFVQTHQVFLFCDYVIPASSIRSLPHPGPENLQLHHMIPLPSRESSVQSALKSVFMYKGKHFILYSLMCVSVSASQGILIPEMIYVVLSTSFSSLRLHLMCQISSIFFCCFEYRSEIAHLLWSETGILDSDFLNNVFRYKPQTIRNITFLIACTYRRPFFFFFSQGVWIPHTIVGLAWRDDLQNLFR